jgi:hypothetical protein
MRILTVTGSRKALSATRPRASIRTKNGIRADHRLRAGELLLSVTVLFCTNSPAESRCAAPPASGTLVSASHFVKKLLALTDVNHGYVTTRDLEQTFNVRLTHQRQESEGVLTKWTRVSTGLHVALTHTDASHVVPGAPQLSGETSRVRFDLGKLTFGQGPCLSAGLLRTSLEDSGWHTATAWGTKPANPSQVSTPADVIFTRDGLTSLPKLTARSDGRSPEACVTFIMIDGDR